MSSLFPLVYLSQDRVDQRITQLISDLLLIGNLNQQDTNWYVNIYLGQAYDKYS